MWTFIIRRLLTVPLLLIGVALITFLLQRWAPGDFFTQMEMDPSKTTADLLRMKADAGLMKRVSTDTLVELSSFRTAGSSFSFTEQGILRDGQPVASTDVRTELRKFTVGLRLFEMDEQGAVYREISSLEGFGRWCLGALRGNFGLSFQHRRPVFELIMERLWNTLKLSLAALVIAWGLAVPLGVLAAVKPGSLPDHLCGLIAFFGLSIPSVFFALLMVLFASLTGWFPIGDMVDVVNYDSMSLWEKVKNQVHHLFLPAIVIGTGTMAGYMRQTRGNMVEALTQDYVRTARAKGLSPNKVLFKHALRNAINPLITLFGYSLAYLLTGSFLVEVVMNWPGMARLVVDAIFAKDEPIVMAAVMVGSLLLVLGNLVADLLLALTDPRVRLS
ncbi:MAG: ABC transporter permease [Planctomycetota bacterium]